MTPDYLAVHDTQSGQSEVVRVVERVGDYARVEGRAIEGWVEVPDNPRPVKPAVVCHDCAHWREHPSGDKMVRANAKQNVCEHEENAELLARIHAAKTGHNPFIQRRAA